MLHSNDKRFIIFDTETNGLQPEKGDKIIEIGIVELINNQRTNRVFHCYLNPEQQMSEESMKIHNIRNEFLLDKPKFGDIVDQLIEFITKDQNGNICDPVLVAHNIQFDVKFLIYELKLIHSDFDILKFKTIDTVKVSKMKYPGQPANLDAICTRLGIDLEERKQKGHGALLDANLLTDVFIELNKDNLDQILIDKIDFQGFHKRELVLEPRDIY